MPRILMLKLQFLACLAIYLSSYYLHSSNLCEKFQVDDLIVDLRDPLYLDDSLSTTCGGVISAPRLRIQAENIRYIRKENNEVLVWMIEADTLLMVQFGDYIFVGEKLFYDLNKQQGVIYEAKSSSGPWFIGGQEIHLEADGTYFIKDGYVTTSERNLPEWGIFSNSVTIENQLLLKAQDVHVRLFNAPILWLPSFRINLQSVFDSPLRYRFRWGGKQGPRFGLTYEIFSWETWKTFVRFDYRITRGPGGGIETYYRSPDHLTEFHCINYLARDSSILHLNEKARYQFEGNFRKVFSKKTNLLITYDKISDKDMPNCYDDDDFFIETSYRTQLLLRHQEPHWIGNFYSRVRLNGFQTVKQELPTFDLNIKSFEIPRTGIIFENRANISYLDFKYSNHFTNVHDYASTRFEYCPSLYRPVKIASFLTFTPEAGAIAIFYGDAPNQSPQHLLMGKASCDLRSHFFKCYTSFKHVVEPYMTYRYYTSPTSCANEHYIFDISDGLTQLNDLTFGFNNSLYLKDQNSNIFRLFNFNLFACAFFNTHRFKEAIPRIYGDLVFFTKPTLKHSFQTAWNFNYNQLDYFNYLTEWTLSCNFAITAEYRHRGPYSWRKVDPQNFFLDMFRSEQSLRHSSLSDRRDTVLVKFFYRFHPNLACEFSSRQGWNRHREKNYSEYELDLLTTIQTAWNVRLSFQHQENDTRVAMYITVEP